MIEVRIADDVPRMPSGPLVLLGILEGFLIDDLEEKGLTPDEGVG